MSTRPFLQMLRREVAVLQAQYPEREGQIARASALIANGHVVPLEGGEALVLSSTDPGLWYTVNVCRESGM